MIYKLLCNIWETEEMPQEWNIGLRLLCPIFKKGIKVLKNHYRRITLLRVLYKWLSYTIIRRRNAITKNMLSTIAEAQKIKL